MTKIKSYALPYTENSAEIFQHFAELPFAVFLDSCRAYQADGRYDIISAEPIATLTTKGQYTTVRTNSTQQLVQDNPFILLKQRLNALAVERPTELQELPFTVGAIGYFAYDLARHLETLPCLAQHDISLPEAIIGIYDWSIVIDHDKQQSWLISLHSKPHPKMQRILQCLQAGVVDESSFHITQPFYANMSKTFYQQAFERIQTHILEGDCYEINLCQRFSSEFAGNPWLAYLQCRQFNAAPFAAFLRYNNAAILSLSPERFIQVHGSYAETKPIKGTTSRFSDPKKDRYAAQQLLKSEKDRAENLMIVDLLRNDFGKCCIPGSIKVPKLFALESFSNVHHLVSTIVGILAPAVHSLDLLCHAFPGGSITGAPKHRSMQIIESLEPHRRSVYCGSIGYIDANGDMDTNIAIRTLICDGNRIHCYTGGAITSDSNWQAEYDECLVKVQKLIDIIEQFGS